jgi:hypothetical protein
MLGELTAARTVVAARIVLRDATVHDAGRRRIVDRGSPLLHHFGHDLVPGHIGEHRFELHEGSGIDSLSPQHSHCGCTVLHGHTAEVLQVILIALDLQGRPQTSPEGLRMQDFHVLLRCEHVECDVDRLNGRLRIQRHREATGLHPAFSTILRGLCMNLRAICTTLRAIGTNLRAICTNLRAICTNLRALCTNLRALCTNLRALCTNLRAIRTNLRAIRTTLQSSC